MTTTTTPSGPVSFAMALDSVPRRLACALDLRITTLLEVLAPSGPLASLTKPGAARLVTVLGTADASVWWLVQAVLQGELPTQAEVLRSCRRSALGGADATLGAMVAALGHRADAHDAHHPPIEVVVDTVVVDVHLTHRTSLATGIQRVVRETVSRWITTHDPVLVGWTDDLRALRRLTAAEVHAGFKGAGPGRSTQPSSSPDTAPARIVPWRGVFIEPEVVGEPARSARLLPIGAVSSTTLSVLAYDCVPVSSSETAADDVTGWFAKYLSAVKHADRLVADSQSAAAEFRGFRRMLSAQGLTGPEIHGIPLPSEMQAVDEQTISAARTRLGAFSLPLVLCVGSHEPRKNHLAVLHAAERAWRDGHRFILVFVGGNGWNSENFDATVERMRGAGRPVDTIRALPDDLLWAAYSIARCVLFPSLHEGFGLPVAEALAARTPVITSNFGSMAELARDGGALTVDPRDDHALAHALKRLVSDDALHARLREEATHRPSWTWDEYSEQVWARLAGQQPVPDPSSFPV